MMLIRAFVKPANRPQRRDRPTARFFACCCRGAPSLHARCRSPWSLMSFPWSVRRRAMRHRRSQVPQQICCCSRLLRLQVRSAMRRTSSLVQVATNSHRCSAVWRIAVCRCPAGERGGKHSASCSSPQLLRALQRPIGQSEAPPCAWRWQEMQSTLQDSSHSNRLYEATLRLSWPNAEVEEAAATSLRSRCGRTADRLPTRSHPHCSSPISCRAHSSSHRSARADSLCCLSPHPLRAIDDSV